MWNRLWLIGAMAVLQLSNASVLATLPFIAQAQTWTCPNNHTNQAKNPACNKCGLPRPSAPRVTPKPVRRVEKKTETVIIPPEIDIEEDPGRDKTLPPVLAMGRPGRKEVYYRITYIGDQRQKPKYIGEKTILAPVNTIKTIGTREAQAQVENEPRQVKRYKEEPVPYAVTEIFDETLNEDVVEVVSPGKNGIQLVEYIVTKLGDEVLSETRSDSAPKPRVAPINAKVRKGTKKVDIFLSFYQRFESFKDSCESISGLSFDNDGTLIYFRAFVNNQYSLFSCPVDGSSPPEEVSTGIVDYGLTSDDELYYTIIRNGKTRIVSSGTDLTELKILTDEKSSNWWPRKNPESETVAFLSNRDKAGDVEIFLMNTDGTNVRNLSRAEGDQWCLSWSSDGNWIVCLSENQGQIDVCLLSEDGTVWRNLTNSKAIEWYPTFSPDGKKIAYWSNQSGAPHAYILDLETMTTSIDALEGNPRSLSWNPESNTLTADASYCASKQIFASVITRNGKSTIKLGRLGGQK